MKEAFEPLLKVALKTSSLLIKPSIEAPFQPSPKPSSMLMTKSHEPASQAVLKVVFTGVVRVPSSQMVETLTT